MDGEGKRNEISDEATPRLKRPCEMSNRLDRKCNVAYSIADRASLEWPFLHKMDGPYRCRCSEKRELILTAL